MRHLVTFRRDWADEFDVYGFAIYSQEQVDALREWASTERTDWFGTNEGWEDEVLIDSFQFQEITDEEAAVIGRFFPQTRGVDMPHFGHIPLWVEE
jgi:hypothetical protein